MWREHDVGPREEPLILHQALEFLDPLWVLNACFLRRGGALHVVNDLVGNESRGFFSHDALVFEHIKACSHDDPLVERLNERTSIDKAATRRIDNDNAFLASRECFSIQEVMRFPASGVRGA